MAHARRPARRGFAAVAIALLAVVAAVVAAVGCPAPKPGHDTLPGLTIAQHSMQYFPIDTGPHAVDCVQCHTKQNTFTEFNCVACHEHEPVATDILHGTVDRYAYKSVDCYSCHPKGVQVPIFDHATGKHTCALCHDEGAAFHALPKPGFTHPDRGGNDCSGCHFSTTDWSVVGTFPPGLVNDPLTDVNVDALVPTYAGTSITAVTPVTETLSMPMNHANTQIDANTMLDCAACHNETATYYPGKLHSSLANLFADQPAQCAECHRLSAPTGFVGALASDPPRDPASGEMKHDAVAWLADQPTAGGIVPLECGTCHQAPSAAVAATWSSGKSGTSAPLFHQPLEDAALPQPDSCIDCHANSRPSTSFDTANAGLPPGVVFDHSLALAQTDCARCHADAAPSSTWSGGRFHDVGDAAPSTCLPCHEGERPSSTAAWADPTFRQAPFDFTTNANGIPHGAGQDCVLCHAGPGTGTFGLNQNWQGGNYTHDPSTTAGTTCIACHSAQRPDLVVGNSAAAVLGFDHATEGTGDCFGCHQATVAAGAYTAYFDPGTGTLPGGDWQGGVTYPGAVPIGGEDQLITLTEISLVRSGPNNLVTGTTSITATLYNQMLHTSAALPAALDPGSPTSPDNTVCWHCHTNDNGNVTSLVNGLYHASLDNFSSTPGGSVTPLPQPTSRCKECHTAPPAHIVEKARSELVPMDHGVLFETAVNIGGTSVNGVAAMDCSTCHKSPGNTWADGVFHANINGAVPQDCTLCHYMTVANGAQSDVTSGADYAMRHASAQITFQNCKSCHAGALAVATQAPPAFAQWAGGALHANVAPQPAACVECHAGSPPSTATQSSVTYALAQGATANNGAQWMSHAARYVVGQDCAKCHAADAVASGAAWSKSDSFHAAVTAVTSCKECHGVGAPGDGNNMPSGLVDTTTVTSAASDATTGIPSGTKDQITHADANVAVHDCNFCHTQVGAGTGGVAGKEWAQASFHANFTASSPLILDANTGRCSNCHLNVKPGPGFPVDHAAFTNAAGTQDCASCHSWPGTGTASSPNWLGAEGGFPQFISVGGFLVPDPPAPNTTTVEPGIANLPHPTVPAGTSCAQCHGGNDAGGRNAIAYDHVSPLINTHCASCHEAGSDLVGTGWNGATDLASAAGDTRPFTVAQMVITTAAYPGLSLTVDVTNHFYGTDCSECHATPSGVTTTSTAAAYTNAWSFPHDQTRMTNPDTCILCHGENGLFPAGLVDDPNQSIAVNAKLPTYAATSITAMTDTVETLPMPMDHLTTEVTTTVMNTCTNCHSDTVNYYPGLFHSSLENLKEPEPASCAGCHITSMPTGFVGPAATDPPRNPASGEMKHDAVAWLNDAPTTSGIVPLECGTCHGTPTQANPTVTWADDASGTGPAVFHDALDAAGIPQPDSCIDCHANSRPSTTFTHANAASLPAGVTFDHTRPEAQTDCVSCHGGASYASFGGGRFHRAGDATPSTCLPCHEGERPTSTSTWQSPTFRNSPFDFVTNANGVKHGDGQDCVLCHASPGTGQWGAGQSFQNGSFDHAASAVASQTCIACHTTQRADAVLGQASAASRLGFDHVTDGTGDCIGCHQQTVVAGLFVRLLNPSTNSLPGGDWQGGISYPGDTLIGSGNQSIAVTEIALVRSGANNLVTSTSSSTATLVNAMLHTSSALPPELNAGPAGNPDSAKCFHCHTNNNGTVTSFIDGNLHAAFDNFQANPGDPVTPLPQPTTCLDCHAQMRPRNVVEKAGSSLQPMDHAAVFTAAVSIGGRSVTSVDQIDCGVCHHSPGNAWSDGVFHANIGAAVPADCTTCHYPTVAVTAQADVTSGTSFTMKHASTQITFQNCRVCHAAALSRATQTPPRATTWSGGVLHASVSPQPTACIECHTGSAPSTSTQSTVTYSMPKGGTSTNGGQWMSHATVYVTGRDCALCHQADAVANPSAFSKSDSFHPHVSNVTTCAVCHGTTNGNGTTVGTKNNLPSGLTDSTTVTTAANDATTGIAAGTKDQIIHTDVNVTGHDCNFCHTQVGTGGSGWAAARFHQSFTAQSPLVMNGTSGRCSNCHLNVKPGAGFSFDHSSFTNTGTDCSSCHSWPGTGTATSPNWLGAEGGYPPFITVGGFIVPQPPATTANFTQPGVANLPHPTPGANACTACHSSSAGGKNAIGYDHASTVENNHCSACHEAGSNLVGTVWNGSTTQSGGAGDTRPISIGTLTTKKGGDTINVNQNSCPGGFACQAHFEGVDCYECHNPPTGVSHVTTGSTWTTKWTFPHKESRMSNPSTCRLCHGTRIPN